MISDNHRYHTVLQMSHCCVLYTAIYLLLRFFISEVLVNNLHVCVESLNMDGRVFQ